MQKKERKNLNEKIPQIMEKFKEYYLHCIP